MNRFALLSLYRSLTRHKLYAALNIGGLAVGIAVFIVLGLYVRFETSFERWLPDHNEIYRVQGVWDQPNSPFNGAFNYTMGGLLETLKADNPDLVGTRLRGGEGAASLLRENTVTREDVVQVDPEFLQVFDLSMVEGQKSAALSQPNSAIISLSLARSIFGEGAAIGQTITVSYDEPETYRITGVFADLPNTSDFRFDIVVPLPQLPPNEAWYDWGSSQVQTFVRLTGPDRVQDFELSMERLLSRNASQGLGSDAPDTLSLALQPVAENHLSRVGQEASDPRIKVVTLGLVGGLALLIAVVNYINLATARSVLRAREIAVRKVVGATRGKIIWQLLAEAVVCTSLASLSGLILAELALPFVNAAGGLELAIPYALAIPCLFALSLFVGIAAGFYPALIISEYRAASVLASSRAPGGGTSAARIREVLVLLQFSFSIAFLIGTFVLFAQIAHLRQLDLGYERGELLVVTSLEDHDLSQSQRSSLIERWSDLPSVVSIGTSDTAPGGTGTTNFSTFARPDMMEEGPSLRRIGIGPNFFRTFGIKPIAGRLLGDEFRMDDLSGIERGQTRNTVIDKTASERLGFATPAAAIGQTISNKGDHVIVGVVEDLRFFTPREPHDPSYFQYSGKMPPFPVANIRYQGDAGELAEQLRSVWDEIAASVPFEAETADKRLDEYYEQDERTARLFAIGAGLAVLIGIVGLWGLASFNTARRVKEIGIRKSLGASAADIVKLLIGQFLRPVVIANLIAWPLAYYAMRTWLAGFEERIALSPIYFIAASLVAIAIAMMTVLGQSLRASRTPPAWALRHD